jgi:hypothetical protein
MVHGENLNPVLKILGQFKIYCRSYPHTQIYICRQMELNAFTITRKLVYLWNE